MTTKILIPLDGSISAETVLDYLRWLGTPDSMEIVLASVIESAYYAYGSMNYTAPDFYATIWSDTEKYLQEKCAQLRRAGYVVTSTMGGGDPAGELLDMVQTLHVDRVAMTTHGRSGFMRWALGSVAERVLQAATVPVFLVRDSVKIASHYPSRIMVPLDGSTFAEQALSKATELAQHLHSELLLFNAFDVSETSNLRFYAPSQAALDELVERWHKEMGDYLSGKAESLRTQGVVVETRMVLGDVAKGIDDSSVTDNVGLIVMSTHGRSGLKRWMYGSVANKVLRSVDCPLLLVRPVQSIAEEAANLVATMSLPVKAN